MNTDPQTAPPATRRIPHLASLRWKLIRLLLWTWLVALVIIVSTVSYFTYRNEQKAWSDRQGDAARNAAHLVSTLLTRVDDTLLALRLLNTQASAQRVNDLLNNNPALLELALVDTNGKLQVGASNEAPVLGRATPALTATWYVQAKDGKPYLGMAQAAADAVPYLIVSQPAPNGGVAAARVRMEVLWQVVGDIRFGDTGQAYIVNRTGELIAHTDPSLVMSHATIAGRPELQAMLQAPDNQWNGEYANFQGAPVIGSTAAIPNTDWIVVTEIAEYEAFAPSRKALLFLGLGLVALGALVALLTLRSLGQLVLQPMELMRDGVQRIGQGDLLVRMGLERDDEIGVVATAFDRMAERLHEHERQIDAEMAERRRAAAELSRLNEQLEDRVRERTAELTTANVNLSHQVTERERAELAEREQRTLAEALRDTAAVINSTIHFDEVLMRVLDNVDRVAPYDAASIYLVEHGVARVAGYRAQAGLHVQRAMNSLVLVVQEAPNLRRMTETGEGLAYSHLPVPGWVVTDGFEWVQSYAGAPISVKGEVVGFINLLSAAPGFFNATHAERLQAFANQAAIAIENARLYAETQQRAERMAVLNDIGQAIASVLGEAQLAEMIFVQARRVLDADAGYIALYDEEHDLLHFPLTYDDGQWFPSDSLPLGSGPASQVIRTKTPILTTDAHDPLLQRGTPFGFEERLSASSLHVPMLFGDRAIGAVSLQSYRERAYDTEDLLVLQVIAGQAAIAFENARLYAQTGQRLKEVNILHQASQALNSNLALEVVLDTVADHLIAALEVETCTIVGWDERSGMITILLDRDSDEAAHVAVGSQFPISEFRYWSRIVEDPRPIAFRRDMPGSDEAAQQLLANWRFESLLIVPLNTKGRLTGVVELGNHQQARNFSRHEMQLAESLANQAAAAIENARLFAAATRHAERLTILHHASRDLSRLQNLDEVYVAIHDAVGQLMPNEAFVIGLLDEERNDIEAVYMIDRGVRYPTRRFPLEGMSGRVATSRQPLYAPDLAQLDLPLAQIHFGGEEHARSWLGVPLMVGERVIGVLSTQSYKHHAFDADDQSTLSLLANQAAVAIENGRLYVSVRQKADELAALYRASEQLLSPGGGLHAMANEITQAMVREFAAARCFVFWLNAEGAGLTQIDYAEPPAPHPPETLALDGPGLVVTAFRTGEAVYAPNVIADPRYLMGDVTIRSELDLPLKVGGKVMGVLNIESVDFDSFDTRARRVLTTFAERASLALDNARLLEELEHALRRANELAETAAEANRLKSEFLANTSHELRTPLTAILGSLNAVVSGLCDTPEEQMEFVKLAYTASENLLTIINDVLDIAKIESGKMDVRLEPVDAASLLKEVHALTQIQAQTKNLRFEIAPLPPALPRVSADPAKLRQVLLNLVGNAIKFTSSGSVTISLRADPVVGYMQIMVADTGIGIPANQQGKLFQPFVQADGGMTRRYGGTGLGLSISRQLAEAMGGTLTLFSAGEGQGCTFTLTLPLAKAVRPAESPPEKTP